MSVSSDIFRNESTNKPDVITLILDSKKRAFCIDYFSRWAFQSNVFLVSLQCATPVADLYILSLVILKRRKKKWKWNCSFSFKFCDLSFWAVRRNIARDVKKKLLLPLLLILQLLLLRTNLTKKEITRKLLKCDSTTIRIREEEKKDGHKITQRPDNERNIHIK